MDSCVARGEGREECPACGGYKALSFSLLEGGKGELRCTGTRFLHFSQEVFSFFRTWVYLHPTRVLALNGERENVPSIHKIV